jgi:hypothetical protein
VAQPIICKEITTAFEGRAIGGSWAVEEGHVRVRTAQRRTVDYFGMPIRSVRSATSMRAL